MRGTLVLIAQAHGKNTSGKRSPDGIFREYAWSREITKIIVEKLRLHNISTYIINPEENEVKLSVQCQRANQYYKQFKEFYDDIILISPHVNAGPKNEWSNACGWTVWVYNKASKNSRRLARIMADLAYDKYKLKGNRYIPESRIFEANFAILRDTICPSILTENMFQTNHNDVNFLMSNQGKEQIANLHVEAILKYINKE